MSNGETLSRLSESRDTSSTTVASPTRLHGYRTRAIDFSVEQKPILDVAATSQKGHCLALMSVVTKEGRLSREHSAQQTSQDVSSGPEHLGRRDIDAMKDVNDRSQ